MNTTAHQPDVFPPAQKEFLPDHWLLWLFVLAQLAFAASVAVALLTADARLDNPHAPWPHASGERLKGDDLEHGSIRSIATSSDSGFRVAATYAAESALWDMKGLCTAKISILQSDD
jgi:hypothetical protein